MSDPFEDLNHGTKLYTALLELPASKMEAALRKMSKNELVNVVLSQILMDPQYDQSDGVEQP